MKFTVAINMEDIGTFDNFFDASKLFFEKILEILKAGTSTFAFETANWIEIESDMGSKVPLLFYDARDLAIDCGILLKPKAPGLPPTLVPPPTDPAGHAAYVEKLRRGIIAAGVHISQAEVENMIRGLSAAIESIKEDAAEAQDPKVDAVVEYLTQERDQNAAELTAIIAGTYGKIAAELTAGPPPCAA